VTSVTHTGECMIPWINYHHLYYFKSIAEEGSVSRAAEKLRVGQPTLSAQLKQLEATLGVPLFERHHKKLVLTEHGKIALDYSKSIFKMGSEMLEVIHDRLKPHRPTLHIGALDSVPKQVLLRLVKLAFQISPCQITLSEGNSDELVQGLVSHKIDVIVTNFMPIGRDAKALLPKKITKRNVAFFGGPKFKYLRKGFPRSISGAPLIVPTYDSKLRYDLDHWVKLNEIDLNIIVESQDIGMKKLMAVNEMGVIPTATYTVTKQVLSGELFEIGKIEGVYEELLLLTAQRKIGNPLLKCLVKSFSV